VETAAAEAFKHGAPPRRPGQRDDLQQRLRRQQQVKRQQRQHKQPQQEEEQEELTPLFGSHGFGGKEEEDARKAGQGAASSIPPW
jgi:hypothetical protein